MPFCAGKSVLQSVFPVTSTCRVGLWNCSLEIVSSSLLHTTEGKFSVSRTNFSRPSTRDFMDYIPLITLPLFCNWNEMQCLQKRRAFVLGLTSFFSTLAPSTSHWFMTCAINEHTQHIDTTAVYHCRNATLQLQINKCAGHTAIIGRKFYLLSPALCFTAGMMKHFYWSVRGNQSHFTPHELVQGHPWLRIIFYKE